MRLIIDLKIPPENIVFVGDSAGGGLCLATMMYLRDEGYPLPSGAILMSPWVDLTMSCEVGSFSSDARSEDVTDIDEYDRAGRRTHRSIISHNRKPTIISIPFNVYSEKRG